MNGSPVFAVGLFLNSCTYKLWREKGKKLAVPNYLWGILDYPRAKLN